MDVPFPVYLTSHEIVPSMQASIEINGKLGKTNVNIASLSLQLPTSVIPSLPIVVVPKSDTIIISLNGFPFETPT